MDYLILNKQIQFPLSGSFSGSLYGTASHALTSSFLINNNYINSGSINASVNVNNDLFLISSASYSILKIDNNLNTTLNSDLFLIKSYNDNEILLRITPSNIQFKVHSQEPTGSTSTGTLLFTSSSFYVGLE